MPDPSLSAAIKEAYASAPTDSVILHTLELRHPDFVAPIRVVNDHANLTATLEAAAPVNPGQSVEFIRFAFRFTMPELMTTGTPEIEIEIDNVDASIVAYMDAAAQSDQLIEVTYRPYLSTDLSAPQMDPPITLVMHDVECDVFAVRGRASFGDFANYRFPTETYDQERFPGLVG